MCLKRLLIWIFKILSISRYLRQTIIQYTAFRPPEVGYLVRNRNEIINTQIELSRTNTLQDQQSPMLHHPKRHSHIITNEHLQIASSPKIKYYNTLKNTNYIQQQRYPINQEQYPQQDFNFISTELKAMEIDSNPGFPISSYVLQSGSGNLIASIYIEFNQLCDQIILYSHGNSTDIGQMFDTYIDIVMECQINLFSYDYSGYGQSTGIPTDINLIYDIESAYQFLVQQLKFDPKNIIIYGYSIGSGPSTNLASRYNVGGLIVHSGLSSGLRVLDTTIQQTNYNDFFPNVDYIVDVTAPVYLLHGGNDSMINVVHAEQLAQKANHLFSVWLVEKGEHGDIELQWKELYYIRLKRFLQYCMTAYVYRSVERQKKRQIAHIYDEYEFNQENIAISLLEF